MAFIIEDFRDLSPRDICKICEENNIMYFTTPTLKAILKDLNSKYYKLEIFETLITMDIGMICEENNIMYFSDAVLKEIIKELNNS